MFRGKIFLQRNIVYNNRNFIPFYNVGTESEGHGRPDYGTEAQTYIIDGSGVYVTRNKDTYHHGRMWLKYNKAFNNGINGLVVHKTDRALVIGNSLWDNGQVPRSAPESRQPYAGLTLNNAVGVKVEDNYVKTERKDDYAYIAVSGSKLTSGSGNNKVRKRSGFNFVNLLFFRTAKYLLKLVQDMVWYTLSFNLSYQQLHGLTARMHNLSHKFSLLFI